ncbi:hypothetical protein [Roseomonas sp. AR75]|uniref:hypothetical protein n=1 Tax=Roseomonas sp. AR75 TaxID=2562311 RepID=UPI0010C0459E|nr:hypothetical protein [Roseomonas sp. AR75]
MRSARILLAALGAAGLAACADQQAMAPAATPAAAAAPAPAGPPQGAAVAETMQRTAVVETVNMQERSVLLRGDAGSQNGVLVTLKVGPQVRNLAQIKPGDRVVYTVTDAVAAVFARPGDGAAPEGAGVLATRAAPGQRPAASLTVGNRVRVRVDSIDLGRNSVTFTEPDGRQRTVRVQDPAMRRFMRTLSQGDMVDVVLIETADLRVLPPA